MIQRNLIFLLPCIGNVIISLQVVKRLHIDVETEHGQAGSRLVKWFQSIIFVFLYHAQ